jgi:flagellar motor protein MotB
MPIPPDAPSGEGGLGENELGVEDVVGTYGDTVADMMNTFRTYMAQMDPDAQLGDYHIDVAEGDTFIQITLPDAAMFFAPGQAVLQQAALDTLNTLGPLLATYVEMGRTIVVEGHTDNVPMRTAQFPSNRHLSSARASAVVEFLTENWGIDPRAIVPAGLSEYLPIDTNDTTEGRQRNRRVEIKVFDVGDAAGVPGAGAWVIPMN